MKEKWSLVSYLADNPTGRGDVSGVRRVAVDVPGEEGGWVGLGEEAVRQQPVAQEVPGAQAEYLGS